MEYSIRDARADDKPDIVAFTRETFAWGDYVTESFDRWLNDPNGLLMVAVDEEDTAIAMGRGVMLSPTELWLQGARVHPDWRRMGIASSIDGHIESWAQSHGAQVSRLAVENWNQPARRQVERIGMRPIGTWIAADLTIGTERPMVATNGARRPPAQDRLIGAASAEAAPAFMAWSTGQLGKAARQLVAVGWTWRRLSMNDLVRAAQGDALWMSRTGWAMAAVDDDTLEVGWIESNREDASDFCRAVIELAAELEATRVAMKVPDIDWMSDALEAQGFELSRSVLYAKAL